MLRASRWSMEPRPQSQARDFGAFIAGAALGVGLISVTEYLCRPLEDESASLEMQANFGAGSDVVPTSSTATASWADARSPLMANEPPLAAPALAATMPLLDESATGGAANFAVSESNTEQPGHVR